MARKLLDTPLCKKEIFQRLTVPFSFHPNYENIICSFQQWNSFHVFEIHYQYKIKRPLGYWWLPQWLLKKYDLNTISSKFICTPDKITVSIQSFHHPSLFHVKAFFLLDKEHEVYLDMDKIVLNKFILPAIRNEIEKKIWEIMTEDFLILFKLMLDQ